MTSRTRQIGTRYAPASNRASRALSGRNWRNLPTKDEANGECSKMGRHQERHHSYPGTGGKTTRKDIGLIAAQEAKPPGKTSELSRHRRQNHQERHQSYPGTGGKTTRKDIRVIPAQEAKQERLDAFLARHIVEVESHWWFLALRWLFRPTEVPARQKGQSSSAPKQTVLCAAHSHQRRFWHRSPRVMHVQLAAALRGTGGVTLAKTGTRCRSAHQKQICWEHRRTSQSHKSV